MTQREDAAIPAAEDPLNKRIFAGSAVIHRRAERRPFQVCFFKAELPRDAYVAYLGRLSFVYEAIEEADEALRGDPVVGRMHSPELHRRTAIARDLEFFAGPGWREGLKPSAATECYVERIRWARTEFPPAYVAHQWLRYLGNVLAQPILQRIMRKTYGLDEEGMDFYRFPRIPDPKAYLGEYHARMNSMPLGEEHKQKVVDEGSLAFQLQIDLTDELAAEFGITGPSEEEADRLLRSLAAEHP